MGSENRYLRLAWGSGTYYDYSLRMRERAKKNKLKMRRNEVLGAHALVKKVKVKIRESWVKRRGFAASA